MPRVRFSTLPDVVEHEVECEARVFSSEDLKREARKLDTVREDLDFGRARARREALELERDTVGITTSELPLVVRGGR
eukprot:7389585-Alexandrium_andersonii.AAC.1